MKADKKILIIDDEADIRFLLRRALTYHNFSVKEAGNLKQGLEIYHQTSPDVIILDVNLPDGNGIQFAGQFKKANNMLILISADNDQLLDDFKMIGASGFIRKPFVPNELIAIIEGPNCS